MKRPKKVSDLVPGTSFTGEARGLHYDSRKIESGFLFFAVPGFKEDGTAYVKSALQKGAVAAVVKKGSMIPKELKAKCIEVDDVRRALAVASAEFYDHPSRKLKVYGVTGTKGKTSSVYILEAIFRAAGRQTALMGTVEIRHPGRRAYSEKTTMESLDLQSFLAEAVENGSDTMLMEVSSHALSLSRVWGLVFEGMLFTNLSEDHLDFYGDMETYFQGKKLLFGPPYRRNDSIAVTNKDEPYGVRIAKECAGRWLTFGSKDLDQKSDFEISNVKMSSRQNSFTLSGPGIGSLDLTSRLVGDFSIPNAAGAAVLALGSGIGADAIRKGVAEAYVPGRLDQVETRLPFTVFIDYAHMGHALENVLRSLRRLCAGKLIVVFGAGGDRPPDRRTQMGTVAAQLADVSVITSDNPRSEDPLKIIASIESAFRAAGGKECLIEPDRKRAIEYALGNAQAGDIVCIAGKGHETGQLVAGRVFPFDDREEAAAALRELEKKQGVDTIL